MMDRGNETQDALVLMPQTAAISQVHIASAPLDGVIAVIAFHSIQSTRVQSPTWSVMAYNNL